MRVYKSVFLIFLFAFTTTQSSIAGVGGVGNTGDITIQLDLAKEVAVQVLKNVSVFALEEQVGRSAERELYFACRASMYRGAVLTKFKVVDRIVEDNGLDAIAQRVGDETLISRHEYARMSELGQIDMPFLVTLVIQEVGHDCKVNGKPVDDEFDSILNQLAIQLYNTVSRTKFGSLKDLQFIEAVRNNETSALSVDLLSPESLRILVDSYLDYVGDWLYKRYESRFYYRPTSASNYYADLETSVFPGWHQINQAVSNTNTEINAIVYGLLRATFEEKSFFIYHDFRRIQMPSRLKCTIEKNAIDNLDFALCQLKVSWAEIPETQLQQYKPRIWFEVDVLGRIKIRSIQIKVDLD